MTAGTGSDIGSFWPDSGHRVHQACDSGHWVIRHWIVLASTAGIESIWPNGIIRCWISSSGIETSWGRGIRLNGGTGWRQFRMGGGIRLGRRHQ
ncbi:unnamed protein product, partial [Staurois parvus]